MTGEAHLEWLRSRRIVSLDAIEGPTPKSLIEPDLISESSERSECCLRLRNVVRQIPAIYRRTLVDHFVRDEDSTQDGGCHRLDHLRTGSRGPEHGRQADDDGAFRKELGTQTVNRPRHDRLAQLLKRQVGQPACLLDRLAKVDQHDDSRGGRHAKTGDVADPDRRREGIAE